MIVAAVTTLAASTLGETTGTKAASEHAKHEHEAPHSGTLIVLGEEFAHLELVLGKDSNAITAYVLDGEAENPIRIAQSELQIFATKPGSDGSSVTVTLKAVEDALTGEKVGSTSEFSGPMGPLKDVQSFTATLSRISVKGQDFRDVKFSYPDGNEK
jgi:hypothetical protein